MGQKGIIACSFVPKISKMGHEIAELWLFSLERLCDPLKTTWDIRGSLGVLLYQKDPKWVNEWLSHGNFPMGGCVIPLRTILDKRGSLYVVL